MSTPTDISSIIDGILKNDRVRLGRAITLIESTRADHQQTAQEIIEKCLPHAGDSYRIGVTGTPGVGKSTFIDSMGNFLVEQEKKVAVLAIDPSSQRSRGSILGDKTRMEQLANHPQAFIRPSPAGATLGGVARKTRETIILCEAAGFNNIFIETVGVGQSETAVHSMVDFFLLLLLPGAGDELQGIKRGIVEMADGIVINKAETDRMELAKKSKQAYRNAVHLYPAKESGFSTKVELCSSLTGNGIEAVWKMLEEYQTFTKSNNYFNKRRAEQSKYWLLETVREGLLSSFFGNETITKAMTKVEAEVVSGKRSPFEAAEFLLNIFRKE